MPLHRPQHNTKEFRFFVRRRYSGVGLLAIKLMHHLGSIGGAIKVPLGRGSMDISGMSDCVRFQRLYNSSSISSQHNA